MAFLSTSDFAPLFQLLNTCDNTYQPHRRSTQSRPTRFTPAFDVRELTDGYYLDGELPGVNQSNIDIEFSDSHTLVVKGHAGRDYKTTTTESAIAPEPRVRSRQATVEDDDESDSDHSDTAASVSSSNSTPVPTPGSTPGPDFKYWASERSVGEFKRTFNFPTRVDQDGVRASLKDGVLSIVVPKQAEPKAKKIRIE